MKGIYAATKGCVLAVVVLTLASCEVRPVEYRAQPIRNEPIAVRPNPIDIPDEGPLTNVATIALSPIIASQAGREVLLTRVEVRAKPDPGRIYVGPTDDMSVLVNYEGLAADVNVGDLVNVAGILRRAASPDAAGWNRPDQSGLPGVPVYVEATRIALAPAAG